MAKPTAAKSKNTPKSKQATKGNLSYSAKTHIDKMADRILGKSKKGNKGC